MSRHRLNFSWLFSIVCLATGLRAEAVEVGAARINVTPTEPTRLTGYAVRKTSHVGVEQQLWAKALAIGSDREGPAVLLTLDNCGIAEETWREARSRLGRDAATCPRT